MRARRILIILAAIAFYISTYIGFKLSHQIYTSQEIDAVKCATSSISPAEILEVFREEGIGDRRLAGILGASIFTVKRIRLGDSSPTPSFEASIRGLYSDYLLLESNLLFKVKYTFRRQDQYYAFRNPAQEEIVSQESQYPE